jgi:hypothetical protein
LKGDWDTYEREQLRAIQVWKETPPTIVERALGYIFRPIAWLINRVVPPSAVEGALRAADWLAQQTISGERVIREAGVTSTEDLRRLKLREPDTLADSFHKWAVGYAVLEGGAAGAIGLPGIAIDLPSLVTMALRAVRGIGVCYGYTSDSEEEREFVFGVLAAAGANSLAEKTSALLYLRQLEVTLLQQTFKAMAEKAAEQTFGKETAIVALRDVARQLGVNLTKRKMLQAVPFVGAAVGAGVNWTFMDDVAWAARRAYQERWFSDRTPSTRNVAPFDSDS